MMLPVEWLGVLRLWRPLTTLQGLVMDSRALVLAYQAPAMVDVPSDQAKWWVRSLDRRHGFEETLTWFVPIG
jgi:hypothetical protein